MCRSCNKHITYTLCFSFPKVCLYLTSSVYCTGRNQSIRYKVGVGMLYRTRSYPEGLCQQSLQNTFRTDRSLPKQARLSDSHGSFVAHKLRRADASECHDQRKDKKSPRSHPVFDSLTQAKTRSLNRSRREFLTQKVSTTQSTHVALIPISVTYKERSCKDLYLSSKSQNKKFHPETALQRHVIVREGNDESESNNSEVHGDLRFAASDSFVRQQKGKVDIFPTSTVELPEIGSTEPSPTESVQSREGTTLQKIWTKKKEKRRMGSLIILNILAALYGSSNVVNGIVADAAPSLPVSLTSLVRFTSALIFFAPALTSALKNRDMELLRAGAELGGLAFSATVVDSWNPTSGSSSSAALLFAFTVIFVPIMELCAGRRSGSTLTRFATLAAISGMGILEEEGFGWKGISCPQIGDLWGMTVSIISAVHIFRSESHCGRFDPLLLNAVQCGVLSILSLGWEIVSTFDASAFRSNELVDQVQTLPWAPLIYNGLVCFGLCSWLELYGLRSLHASTATLVYTTIPVWGAFLSFFSHHETPADSAIIGGLVIMVTSIYAQMTTTNADISHQKKACASTSSGLKPSYNEQGSNVSESDRITTVTKDELTKDRTAHDYFPGALLTSQLKFPYYAAQAKRLLAEVKIKLGAVKSVLMNTISSGIVNSMSGTSTPGSPGVNPGNGTAPAGAPSSNVTGANGLPGGTSTVSSVTSHIVKVDASTVQHIQPHGSDIIGPISSSGSDIVSEALKTTHMSGDLTNVVVNVGAHFLTAVITGLESALIVIGSDIMLGCEGAEDIATLLERVTQVTVENAAHTVAACLHGGAAWVNNTSSIFVESAAHLPQELASGEKIILPFQSHVAEGVTDSLVQNVLPLLNHIG